MESAVFSASYASSVRPHPTVDPRDDTIDRLIDALNQDQFILYQQPIKPVVPGRGLPTFHKIAVRFREEEEKLLPPGTFVPVLESANLMHLLDRWVLNRLIQWVHRKRRADVGWQQPHCSIDLSNDSIHDPKFGRSMQEQLRKGGVNGRKLSFELAEVDAYEHSDALQRVLTQLRAVGCGFTLTNYSGELIGPERATEAGFNAVKLDTDIVFALHRCGERFKQAKALQRRCEVHGVRTIAEFVEEEATVAKLKELGIDYAQGHGIARPELLA